MYYAMYEVESESDWLLEKMNSGTTEEKENVAMLLWGIWFACNQKVWEDKIINPSTVVELTMKQKLEWQEAMKVKQLKTTHLTSKPAREGKSIKWSPPREGWYKLNVNASLFAEEQSYSVGMVLRDEHGQFVQGKNMRFEEQVSVMEAEARGVEEGIRWIEVLDVHNVKIESDSIITENAVSKEVQYFNEAGHIFEYCYSKLKQRSDSLIKHVKK